MTKKILTLLMAVFMISALTACGGSNNADTNGGVETTTPAPTEAPHTHAYAEEITTPATCEADGLKTFTCECGDAYTEVITATGHTFEAYASNNDASYTAEGTETAKCNNCDVTDTRTAEGSMLTYTYTDMDATMYAQKSVNIRNLPSTDGEKLGGLNQNDEVHVTGQCVETGWYRFEYNGSVAFASNGYLGADKVTVQASAPTETSQPSTPSDNPYGAWANGYEKYTWYDMGDYYFLLCEPDGVEVYTYQNSFPYKDVLQARYPDRNITYGGAAPSYGVAVVSATGWNAERRVPIWYADYIWY